ncbi:MAG: 2-keto-4-pentenoate hydratase [Immundisolibacter sp.]|uniref:2-keto-4-pentenoate hydratase n=1 Tax=Immundisolibacter sp. TaxID=1934948 RepID=UPI003EDE929E
MQIAAIVEDFWASRERGVYYPPQWFDRLSLDQACQVQLGLLDKAVAGGAQQVGWKVGLTADAIREQFGVHEPVFGYLLASGRLDSGAQIDLANWQGTGFENELCLRLGKPLRGPGVDVAAARAAVSSCHPAMELVENRGDFTAQLAVAVADNVQQRAFVIGPEVPLPVDADLAAVTCEVSINGAQVAQASGAAVMGDPYASLAWLANKLAEYGRGLETGQYVMSGSFTRQFPLKPGDEAQTRFNGIGPVAVKAR